MAEIEDFSGLISKAKTGDDGCRNRLAEVVIERLYEYICRITLDEHLAQDVVQESLMQMLDSLDDLRDSERFWPWLRRIAASKVYNHYEREKRQKSVPISAVGVDQMKNFGQGAVADSVIRELN